MALYRRPVATHSRPVWHHQCLPPWGSTYHPFPENWGNQYAEHRPRWRVCLHVYNPHYRDRL